MALNTTSFMMRRAISSESVLVRIYGNLPERFGFLVFSQYNVPIALLDVLFTPRILCKTYWTLVIVTTETFD